MIEKILQDLLELGNKYQKRKQEEEEKQKRIQQQLRDHAETAKSKLGIIDKILPNASTKILENRESDRISAITEIRQSEKHGCAFGYKIGIAIVYHDGVFKWYIHGEETSYSIYQGFIKLDTESIIKQKKEIKPEQLESEIADYLEKYYHQSKARLNHLK